MSNSRVVNNAKWIILCKVAQSILQLVLGMLCARYLGPGNYGLVNYAASIVAFAIPLMQLGLQSTLVREFIDSPEHEGKIMGTSFVLELVSSVACMIGVGTFVTVFNHRQTETIIVCLLYATVLFFRAFELFGCWFQYKLKSKYSSLVMLLAYVIVSLYRVYLLMTGKSIYWFAVVNSFDAAIIGILLMILYKRMSSQKLEFSLSLAKELLSRSKYYILSAMMVTIFQNTDHVMLKNISGDEENGYYTAAITCAVIFQFVYQAIVESMRPVILEAKKKDQGKYEKSVSRLYSITVYMGVVQAAVFTVFASLIVKVLYGDDYIAAVPVLRVLVWYIAFSYMGTVRNVWILAEGKQKLLWKLNLAGAAANAAINAILIPYFGAVGAAAASLFTQFFINFALGFFISDLRENNRLLLMGIDPRVFTSAVKIVISSRKDKENNGG